MWVDSAPINEKRGPPSRRETGDNKSAACSSSPVFLSPWRRPFPVSLRRDNLIYLYDVRGVQGARGYTRAGRKVSLFSLESSFRGWPSNLDPVSGENRLIYRKYSQVARLSWREYNDIKKHEISLPSFVPTNSEKRFISKNRTSKILFPRDPPPSRISSRNYTEEHGGIMYRFTACLAP